MQRRTSPVPRSFCAIRKIAAPALAVILLGCSETSHKENVCPIDGQPPEWSGARNGHSCEYFHYSIVEKKTHSWWLTARPNECNRDISTTAAQPRHTRVFPGGRERESASTEGPPLHRILLDSRTQQEENSPQLLLRRAVPRSECSTP
jgi:hypothetical protein